MDYAFYQEYWWLLISILGALLVFLLFVQGGQSLFFSLGKEPLERKLLVNSVGRKWEFTFTTLVVFGGGFFASFPLFYSTSFGGAYWVWMLILFCLTFTVNREAIADMSGSSQVISQWLPYRGLQLHGLEAVLNVWNVVFGLAVFFLSRTTALLFFINNIEDETIYKRSRSALAWNAAAFLLLFLAYLFFLLTKKGFAYSPSNPELTYLVDYKYWYNLVEMPIVFLIFVVGVLLVLGGILLTLLREGYKKGIWLEGAGVVLTALALFLIAGWNNTSYYPAYSADMPELIHHSLNIRNSSSSPFTLKAMSFVSLLIPFVLAYIVYAWRALDLHKITRKEVQNPESHNY